MAPFARAGDTDNTRESCHSRASQPEPPIVVDLDETSIRIDRGIESFFILLASHPVAAIAALNLLRKGKAAFKSKLVDVAVSK